MSLDLGHDARVKPEELLAEIGKLVGRNVAVAYHAGELWNPVLHVQGRLERDWNEPESECTIGQYEEGRRGFDYAALAICAEDVLDAEWRDKVAPAGSSPSLVVTMRDGAVLTISP